MVKIFESISNVFFMFATFVLLAFAGLLIAHACWQVLQSVLHPATMITQILESVGLIIISFAVMELSKFIAEEIVVEKRELQSAREARRSLTRFIATVVIAISLEALVMVFKANRGEIEESIYPTALFASAVFALFGLGSYQWLSSKVEQTSPADRGKIESKKD